MALIVESITSFYDKKEDRLNLVFNGKNQEQVTGLMTRQFFKGLLENLPDWLSLQRSDIIPPTIEQQHAINQIQHQVSQQDVAVTYGKAQQTIRQSKDFLISTLNFTKLKRDPENKDQKVRLVFLDYDKAMEVAFILSVSQLHKLIGEILKQVPAWDLVNPWQDSQTSSILIDHGNKLMH